MKPPRLLRAGGRAPAGRLADRLRFGLACAAVLAAALLAGLWLGFPTEALRQRLEFEARSRAGLELRIAELRLLFPATLEGSGVTVAAPRPPAPSVTLDRVRLRPLWLTLLGGSPGVRLQAELQGGSLTATARKGGALQAELNRVPFAAPLAAGSALGVAGTVTEASFAGELPVQAATATRLRLTAAEVRLTGLEALGLPGGSLPLGTLRLEGSGKGSDFRIEQLTAGGGKIEASGSGTLLLATPLGRSRVNLNLTLRPAPGLDPGIAGLLGVFGQREADGSYRVRFSGTLTAPVAR
jgi:type II secretion system protein N